MESKKQKASKKRQSGFSILEVVIAIFIITMGLIGILSLMGQNLQAKYVNKNGLIASMLAQEGLELVRNKRDNNVVNAESFKEGMLSATYAIDLENFYTVPSINSAAAVLKTNTGGFYCNANWPVLNLTCNPDKSSFSRVVTIVDHVHYLDVVCLVRYKKGNNNYDYSARTQIYDWNK